MTSSHLRTFHDITQVLCGSKPGIPLNHKDLHKRTRLQRNIFVAISRPFPTQTFDTVTGQLEVYDKMYACFSIKDVSKASGFLLF